MKLWLVLMALAAVGCTRTVYLPVESEHGSVHNERTVSKVTDTVIIAERCTVSMMPQGVSHVTQRELVRLRTVHDTVTVVRSDTVKVSTVAPPVSESQGGDKWWIWMVAGALAALGVIVGLRKAFRRSR